MRRKALGETHPDRALALLGIGKVALAEGKPEAAVAPLELGLKLYEGGAPDPQDIGELRWNLARALWTSDETRARALVEQARGSFVEAEIWLAAHQPY